MKAIQILTKFSQEIEKTYQSTGDFNRWVPDNNNVSVMHEGLVYCIDYSITGNRTLKCKLTMMVPDIIDGKKKWFTGGCDIDLKNFIQDSFNALLPVLFDELLNKEINEANSQIAAIESEIQLCETYRSLQNFR